MMHWIIFVLLSLTCYEACVIVPQPIILFPLNAEYQTSDIKNRTAPGIPSWVTLAPGPYGKEDGSYEFFGNANSFIEFPNSPRGALDVQYSMTILCWVYYDEKGGLDGPIFNYNTGGKYGVHLWVVNGLFFARFNDRDFSELPELSHTSLAGGWKFVGASYDNETGDIKLWVDGVLKQTLNIGAQRQLGTQGSVRMGVREKDPRYFKGRISQLQIYNEALSQQQILKLATEPKEPCRRLEFIPDNIFQGYRLKNHVIRTIENVDEDFCGALCFTEYNCVSFNVKVTGGPGTSTICELNDSTHHANPGDLQTLENSIYHGITENPCDESLCQHSSTCQAGFTDKGYRCVCGSGFCGEHCETDIDECYAGNECSANALCHNLHGSYNCTCKEGYYGDGKTCRAGNSCKKIKAIIGEEAINGIYLLSRAGVKFEAYCHIESEEVWTLIARSSNNDFLNWMRRRGQWWFTTKLSVGQTANTSANSDLISPAFWLVSGHEFKITRSDDPQHTALLRTSGDCLGGQTFRAKITSYGEFTNGESWEIQPNEDGCRGSCNVSYAGRFEETVDFKQAKCSGRIQSAKKVGFWCAIESSGSVMMIGGGGQPCTLGDHGIGITSIKDRSFEIKRSADRNDFGDVATSSPETGYSLNLWIQ